MSLGENIKRLRLEAGLQTQKALAHLLSLPQSQVSDWENDRYAILETLTLVKIAKALRCSVDLLLAGVDPDYDRMRRRGTADETPVIAGGAADQIPVIAEGAAALERGPARWEETADIVQWVSRPGDLQDPNAYGVQIQGESMLPTYRPTMTAIVSPRCRVQDGDEAYVHLLSGECLVRLVVIVRRGFVLQPYNHAYAARFVKSTEVRAMHAIVYSRRVKS